jgi:hypothetical protein
VNHLLGILEQYGLSDASLKPLGDTENNNRVVTASSGERFLLLQHRIESCSTMLESEMLLFEPLYLQGLEVQRPMSCRLEMMFNPRVTAFLAVVLN